MLISKDVVSIVYMLIGSILWVFNIIICKLFQTSIPISQMNLYRSIFMMILNYMICKNAGYPIEASKHIEKKALTKYSCLPKLFHVVLVYLLDSNIWINLNWYDLSLSWTISYITLNIQKLIVIVVLSVLLEYAWYWSQIYFRRPLKV